MSHERNCLDPKCQAGAHEVDWAGKPANEAAKDCEACPVKSSRDGYTWQCTECGNRWKGGICVEEVAKPGQSEREREAWELYLADERTLNRPSVDEWPKLSFDWQVCYLLLRDRAEAIFAAKAEEKHRKICEEGIRVQRECQKRVSQAERERDEARLDALDEGRKKVELGALHDAARAEVDRLKARVEDYQRANDSLNEGLSYAQAENKRLGTALSDQHDSALKWAAASGEQQAKASTLAGQVDELVEALRDVLSAFAADTWPSARELLARIDAERGKASKPTIPGSVATTDTGLTEAALAAARAEGRMERTLAEVRIQVMEPALVSRRLEELSDEMRDLRTLIANTR